jgi:hypothetical protein
MKKLNAFSEDIYSPLFGIFVGLPDPDESGGEGLIQPPSKSNYKSIENIQSQPS